MSASLLLVRDLAVQRGRRLCNGVLLLRARQQEAVCSLQHVFHGGAPCPVVCQACRVAAAWCSVDAVFQCSPDAYIAAVQDGDALIAQCVGPA